MAKELKLPAKEITNIRATVPHSKIWEILWAVDPAWIKEIPHDKWQNIIRLNIRYAIRTADIQMQIAKNDMEMLKELEKIYG